MCLSDSELKHVFLMTSLWGWDVAAGTDVVCQNNADLVVIPEGLCQKDTCK